MNSPKHTRPHQRVVREAAGCAAAFALERFMFAGAHCMCLPAVHKCVRCMAALSRRRQMYITCARRTARRRSRATTPLTCIKHVRRSPAGGGRRTANLRAVVRHTRMRSRLNLKPVPPVPPPVVSVLFLIMVQTTGEPESTGAAMGTIRM